MRGRGGDRLGLLLEPAGEGGSEGMVRPAAESGRRVPSACDHSFQRCGQGHRGYHGGGEGQGDRRRGSLLFLYQGDGQDFSEYGILHRDRRRADLQECKKAEGGSGVHPFGSAGPGDGQPISGAGAQ